MLNKIEMKKVFFYLATILALAACSGNNSALKDCDVTLGGIHFTKSINGAETRVSEKDGIITFRALPYADYFKDPNDGKISQDDAAILLTEVDNTKPFTMTAKVTSGFLPEGGLYNAGTFFIYANEDLWQKLCFEHGDHGEHRIVSVRTVGTSDDNNHDVVDPAKSVYFKISSDTHAIASYFSLDGNNWQMVRIYRNEYPSKLYIGISSQAPQAEECVSTFEGLSISSDNVGDFRMGTDE